MRLAYTISGYKQPSQFRWLLEAVWHADDLFAVHVDARTPEPVFQAFQRVAAGRSNVFFVARERVVWMGSGLLRAELRMIRRLLTEPGGFDHLIALSMQCYPLKRREAIVAELEREPCRNFIRMLELHDQPFEVRRRPYLMSFERADKVLRTPLPRLVPKSTPIRFKGSWWRVLSRDFCRWLVDDPITVRYAAFLAHVRAPDELFFQNLIMASPFAATLADDHRHEITWTGRGGSPDTVGMADLPRLEASPMWFTRKVDEIVDRPVLERLAARIGAPVPPPVGIGDDEAGSREVAAA